MKPDERLHAAALTDRSELEVYIPLELREEPCGAVDAEDWDACGDCEDCR
jgi:hypothetical protein